MSKPTQDGEAGFVWRSTGDAVVVNSGTLANPAAAREGRAHVTLTSNEPAPVAFLTARYDEIEAKARAVAALPPIYDCDDTPVSAASYLAYQEGGDREVHDWIVMTAETDTVLAGVRADRAILALHAPDDDDTTFASCGICAKESETWDGESEGWETVFVSWPCDTVRLLVCKFATHPDCRPEWLPF